MKAMRQVKRHVKWQARREAPHSDGFSTEMGKYSSHSQ